MTRKDLIEVTEALTKIDEFVFSIKLRLMGLEESLEEQPEALGINVIDDAGSATSVGG